MVGGSCTEDQECEVDLECRNDICSRPLGMLFSEC